MYGRHDTKTTLLVLLTGGLLGGAYVLARGLAVAGAHPAWMLTTQSLSAGLGLCVFAALRGELRLTTRHLRFYLIGGLTGVTLPTLAGFFALRELSAGLHVLLVTLSPLLTWLIASLVAKQLQSKARLAGVLMGLAGITVVLAPGAFGAAAHIPPSALTLGLLTPLLLAIGNVYRARRLPRDASATSLAGGMLLVQAPIAVTFGLALEAPLPAADQYIKLLVLGGWTLLMYLPYFRLQAVTDAVGFSQIGYVIPLTGIAGGVLFLGEGIPAGMLAGLPLVFAGLAMTNGHLAGLFSTIHQSLTDWRTNAMRTTTSSTIHRVFFPGVILALSGTLLFNGVDAAEAGKSPWGPEDEIGTLNMMSDASRLKILSRISAGTPYDLSVEYHKGMPSWYAIGDPRYQFWMTHTPHGFAVDDPLQLGSQMNRHVSYSGDAVSMYTHMGTHIDSLAHFGLNGRIYNGFHWQEHLGDEGWRRGGAEKLPAIIARGVLIDVAGAKDMQMLPDSYRITAEDLQASLRRQGISLERGDAVFIRTGRMQVIHDNDLYMNKPPGIGLAAAEMLVQSGAMLIGADNLSLETFPVETDDNWIPVHTYLEAEHGVAIMEVVYLEELARDGIYEFAFIGASLKLRGATGAPMRPIALPVQ